jgi:hypothetical protein
MAPPPGFRYVPKFIDAEAEASLLAAVRIIGFSEVAMRGRIARRRTAHFGCLAEMLVTTYPAGAGIGWHRDAPQFGVVIGVSVLGACRFRFQRGDRRGARDRRDPADPAFGLRARGRGAPCLAGTPFHR